MDLVVALLSEQKGVRGSVVTRLEIFETGTSAPATLIVSEPFFLFQHRYGPGDHAEGSSH